MRRSMKRGNWEKAFDGAKMKRDEIAFSVRKTKNLVQEYMDIIEFYKDRKYILDKLADYEVNGRQCQKSQSVFLRLAKVQNR